METCILETCKREEPHGVKRGLCTRCYRVASIAVKAKKVTWEELEKAGAALPNKRKEVGATSPMGKALENIIIGRIL